MEIEEFLMKMDMKGANNTFYKKEKDGEAGINAYTKFNDGSSAVVGFIKYDKDFPEEVFSMNPGILSKIISESDSIYVEDTFLVGTSIYGNIKEDIEPATWKTIKSQYDNPAVKIQKEYINKIIRRAEIIDPNKVTLKGDGKELTITLYSKIGSSVSEVKIPCELEMDSTPWFSSFMDTLNMVRDFDINLYVDIDNPEGRRKSPIKIEIEDGNSKISYYVTETYNPNKRDGEENGE